MICQGSVSVYTKSGSYQLYVQRLLPVGVGDLQLQYEKLKAKLAAEGVFKTEETRRALPRMPKKIGIVTSPTGAVIRDMLRVLRRRGAPGAGCGAGAGRCALDLCGAGCALCAG